jgi:hypothetical protein
MFVPETSSTILLEDLIDVRELSARAHLEGIREIAVADFPIP